MRENSLKKQRFREGDCMQKRKRKRGRGVCWKQSAEGITG